METNLQKKMTARHITMLALGGAIGAGLFKGSGEAIGIAGPSVILAFLIGGMILFIVMSGLGRLILDQENVHGLSGIVQPYLGDHAADFIDWLYWSLWMVNIIAEAVAAATFLQLWFPHVPAWIFVLFLAILTTMINLYSVTLFAETEYWLAFAKITIILILIALGGYLVANEVFHIGFSATLAKMNSHGGFAPHGIKDLISSLLVVIYSYGGSELIAITVSETENPKIAIPKAIKGVMGRIISFYIVPMILLMIIYNWQTLAQTNISPFVLVFEKVNIPFASDIVNFVIVLALFSSINSGVYASSRTLYFRLKDNHGFTKKLAGLNKHQVPQKAVLFCTGTLYIGVILSYFLGNNLFNYLVGSISYSVLLTWMLISIGAFVLAHRKHSSKDIFSSGFAIVALSLILIGIIANNNWGVTLFTGILYCVIFLSFQKKQKHTLPNN
ncbi:amino acid permease [Enterococcus alishanensis]